MSRKLKSLFGIIFGAIMGSILFLLFDTYIWRAVNITEYTPGFIFIVILLGALHYATGFPAGFLAVHIAKTRDLRNMLLISFVTGFIFFVTVCYTKLTLITIEYGGTGHPGIIFIFPVYSPAIITTMLGGLISYRLRKTKDKNRPFLQ